MANGWRIIEPAEGPGLPAPAGLPGPGWAVIADAPDGPGFVVRGRAGGREVDASARLLDTLSFERREAGWREAGEWVGDLATSLRQLLDWLRQDGPGFIALDLRRAHWPAGGLCHGCGRRVACWAWPPPAPEMEPAIRAVLLPAGVDPETNHALGCPLRRRRR
jgi:hypothetical protein